jgi:hypothetical protein
MSRGGIEQPKRHAFRFQLRIVTGRRRPFRHIPAILPDQPLPFPGNVQHRQIARAERGAFDRETARSWTVNQYAFMLGILACPFERFQPFQDQGLGNRGITAQKGSLLSLVDEI